MWDITHIYNPTSFTKTVWNIHRKEYINIYFFIYDQVLNITDKLNINILHRE